MRKRYALKDEFVIPAGSVFSRGPNRREYGGDNYDATIEISPDETANFTLYLSGPDTLVLLEVSERV